MQLRYSDVVHEIKPLESGYRLVLNYNLIRIDYGAPTFANTLLEDIGVCRRILGNWKWINAGQPILCKLAWVLDHKYSELEVSLGNLKGHDDLVGRHMAEVCQTEGFTILFATMIFKRFAADTTSESPPHEELYLRNVLEADGRIKIDFATIQREEVIQANFFDRLPDKFETKQYSMELYGYEHISHSTVSFELLSLCVNRAHS